MPTPAQLAQARTTAAGFCTAQVTITRPSDPTFTGGVITPGTATTIYAGCASISDRRDTHPTDWGGVHLEAGQWLLRAPLDAAQVRPGDLVHVDTPGDYPGGVRDLWVHEIPGRQMTVLARVIVTSTRPGDV